MKPQFTPKDALRFWSKVAKTDNQEDCWLWTASCDSYGYGHIKFKCTDDRLRLFISSRVAYSLTYGEIPAGQCVLHKCDTPLCCNPSHLFLGTKNDNNQDKARKGRAVSGDVHWTRTTPGKLATGTRNGKYTKPESRPRGEQNGYSKLTAAQVVEIRERFKTGEYSFASLGREYGVDHSAISAIVREQTWRHLL